MAVDTDVLRDYLRLDALRSELKAELESVENERASVAETIVQMFGLEGVPSMSVLADDGTKRTIHLRRELWAGHTGDSQALCDALKDSGYGAYVQEKFNVQSLSSLVKELATGYYDKPDVSSLSVEEIMEALPEQVRMNLKISEIFKVGNKKSG